MGVGDWWDPRNWGSGGDYNPDDPNTWSGDQRVAYLNAAGFQWRLGSGNTALWVAPNGEPMDEFTAFSSIATGKVPPPPRPAAGSTDRSGQIGIGPDGKLRYFTYDANGKEVFGAEAPPQNMTPGRTSSYNVSQSYQDPAALALEAQKMQQDYDIAIRTGDQRAAQYAQARLDAIAQQQAQLQLNYAELAQRGSEGAAQRAFQGGEGAANREFQGRESEAQRAFQGGESTAQRAFQGGQSALSRAQQAGEFAASYSIQKANAERQQLADRMQAAETYSRLSGSPDLTGYERFQQAGGGVLGNSLAAGATSLTPQGQLGSARALQAARAPSAPVADYVNPYAGMTDQQILAMYPQPTPYTSMQPRQYGSPVAPIVPVVTPPAMTAPVAPNPYAAFNAVAQQQAAAGANTAGFNMAGSATPGEVGFAYGTGRPPIMRQPGGTLGTMRRPVREAVATPPAGAGIDALTQRYAHGSFVAGDSTDPLDPAAGGAHPEQIGLIDPPGENNAAASVTPMTDPGIGDTSGGDGSIGALLVAIGNFLFAHESGGATTSQPSALGMAGPRYALGTVGTPEDQPYINEVMATRLGTKYNVNPYAYNYRFQSPTSRAIGAAAFQTATGVPGSELGFEEQKYRPGGLARNSDYARELELRI